MKSALRKSALPLLIVAACAATWWRFTPTQHARAPKPLEESEQSDESSAEASRSRVGLGDTRHAPRGRGELTPKSDAATAKAQPSSNEASSALAAPTSHPAAPASPDAAPPFRYRPLLRPSPEAVSDPARAAAKPGEAGAERKPPPAEEAAPVLAGQRPEQARYYVGVKQTFEQVTRRLAEMPSDAAERPKLEALQTQLKTTLDQVAALPPERRPTPSELGAAQAEMAMAQRQAASNLPPLKD